MIKSILVLSFIWISVIISSPLAALLIILNSIALDKTLRPALGFFTQRWAKLVLKMIGVELVVKGLENLPKEDRVVFIGNHQGDLDIIILLAIAGRPVGFISKSQAAWFPFINLWILALGSSFIHRNNPRKGKKAIERGIKSIKRGRALAIFPEGTRSRSFDMLPFRKGAFKLALRSEAIIVPISIDGSFRAWEAEKRIKAAKVFVSIHSPINTKNIPLEERKALPAKVEATIASALSGGFY